MLLCLRRGCLCSAVLQASKAAPPGAFSGLGRGARTSWQDSGSRNDVSLHERIQPVAAAAPPAPTPEMRAGIAKPRQAIQLGMGQETVAGIALWATVSDAVDARITEQIKAGIFPVRLSPEDWASGETVWLLDVVAADRRQATSVLANFRQVAGGRAVKIAPLVMRLIDPEVVAKLRGGGRGSPVPPGVPQAAGAGVPE